MATLFTRKNMWMWAVAAIVLVITLIYLAKQTTPARPYYPPEITEQPYVMPVTTQPARPSSGGGSSSDSDSDDDTDSEDDDTDSDDDELMPPSGAPVAGPVTAGPAGMPMMWPVSA